MSRLSATPSVARSPAALAAGLAIAVAVAATLAALSAPRAHAAGPAAASAAPLATAPVQVASTAQASSFEGTVQAVRQTVVAAQVPGAIVKLPVQAGDHVIAGQLLARLDARAADQQAGAADAQVQAARAAQDAATREFERQKTLFQKNYISQAALERAEAQFKSAQAEAAAQLATAGAARSQTGWYVLRAPYAGVVSEVPVVRGDMALPGRALVTLHDPAAMRVSAQLPQSVASRLQAGTTITVDVPGTLSAPIAATRWDLLPAVDPATHTRELRIDLPRGLAVAPGTFARVMLPGASSASAAPAASAATTTAAAAAVSAEPVRLSVPAQAIVRRAELTALYVVGADGRPLLRQVRLGPVQGDRVEVLSGVSAGERVALDPQAAARVR